MEKKVKCIWSIISFFSRKKIYYKVVENKIHIYIAGFKKIINTLKKDLKINWKCNLEDLYNWLFWNCWIFLFCEVNQNSIFKVNTIGKRVKITGISKNEVNHTCFLINNRRKQINNMNVIKNKQYHASFKFTRGFWIYLCIISVKIRCLVCQIWTLNLHCAELSIWIN